MRSPVDSKRLRAASGELPRLIHKKKAPPKGGAVLFV
jgi:hypothetical protein